jgi:Nucleotidyltransferase domain
MTTPFKRAKEFSELKLQKLREEISSGVPAEATVVTCGSYARREASLLSDIDYFTVLPGSAPSESPPEPPWLEAMDRSIVALVPKVAAEDGAFKNVEYHDDMLHNIGGNKDSNAKISRRILLLLEGEWLANEVGFKNLRREILGHYIKNTITDHQLALFLLNDIIRYYRTIAVDYEFKTEESSKPWAIRNIKLIFSRKLLYASGLFSVAMTADHAYAEKISRLEYLFDLPVVDRMVDICGGAAMEKVLACYNHFLEMIERPELRSHLDQLPKTKAGRDDAQFRRLKNEGHHFTRHILALFENIFGSVHPIRRAVIF